MITLRRKEKMDLKWVYPNFFITFNIIFLPGV